MRFKSQKVAWAFFATCMLLLSLQIIYGFIMGFAHAGYDNLHSVIPFNVARATHTNLLVMWLLAGFMGAAYWIIPDECDCELALPPANARVPVGTPVPVWVSTSAPPHWKTTRQPRWPQSPGLPKPRSSGSLTKLLMHVRRLPLSTNDQRHFPTA